MLKRLKDAGLDITPHILVVSRLIPDAQGTTCNERLEHINGTQHAKILRCVPCANVCCSNICTLCHFEKLFAKTY